MLVSRTNTLLSPWIRGNATALPHECGCLSFLSDADSESQGDCRASRRGSMAFFMPGPDPWLTPHSACLRRMSRSNLLGHNPFKWILANRRQEISEALGSPEKEGRNQYSLECIPGTRSYASCTYRCYLIREP